MSSMMPLQSVGGLASGLDTHSIIAQLMQVEAQPKVRLVQQERLEEARQQAYQDVQTRLQNLSSAIEGLRDVGTWQNTQAVTSSDSTKVGATLLSTAAAGSYKVQVNSLARADQYTSASLPSGVTNGGTLTIAGPTSTVKVTVNAGDSLATIAANINAASGTPVYASVVNSQLILSGLTTGSSGAVTVSGGPAELNFSHNLTAADASFSVDYGDGKGWQAKTSATNVVPDSSSGLYGLQLTLNATTDVNGVTVTVGAPAPNTAAIQTKIQAFVDQYNSTVDFISQKLNEKRVPNPQSDADRAQGVLNGDPSLMSLLSSMRQAVGDVFADPAQPTTLNQLAEVGLSTGSAVGSATLNQDSIEGKLSLDSSKLASALSTNYADVKRMFTNITGAYSTEGLAQRLDDLVNSQISDTGMLTSEITSAGNLITSFKQQEDEMQQRLDLRQQQLQAQFTAMETAMQKAQSQGQWLQGQLAGLPAR